MKTLPPWSSDKALGRIFRAIEARGGEARVVGGAVRDWLLDRPVDDVDIATSLTPDTVHNTLRAINIQVIPTGIDHGTVTAVIDGRTFEITTLRRDVETDGRHAVVSFTTDWREDALRRDFTINTLSASLDGAVFDPLGSGQRDLDDRKLRFAGDPKERIREDYLRILRFYRFQAQIRLLADAKALQACADLAEGLTTLSAERIWQEMRKLLGGAHAAKVLREMLASGIPGVLVPELEGLPSDLALVHGDAILALAGLISASGRAGEAKDTAANQIAQRWKLSAKERKRLLNALPPLPDWQNDPQALYRAAWHDGQQAVSDRLRLAGQDDLAAEVAAWQRPVLPVRGQDVLDRGVPPGSRVGALVREIESWWLDAAFKPDRAACLDELDRRIRSV